MVGCALLRLRHRRGRQTTEVLQEARPVGGQGSHVRTWEPTLALVTRIWRAGMLREGRLSWGRWGLKDSRREKKWVG